jgi:hypothetical protein
MSLKTLVHKLGSSNVIVPYKLLNTHHHEHKQVISKELFSITILLSSHVYVPFQDYVAQIIKLFLLQWCLSTLKSLRSTFSSTIIPFNICHNLIVILSLKKLSTTLFQHIVELICTIFKKVKKLKEATFSEDLRIVTISL